MGVREATLADVHEAAQLVRRMTRGFKGPVPWAYDYASAYERLSQAVISENEAVFLSGTGFLFAVCYQLPFNRGVTVASELGFYDEGGQGGALLDAFEKWASEKGADLIDLATMAGNRDKAVARVYKSRGYQLSEIHFVKAVPK